MGKEPATTLVIIDGAGSHQANVLSSNSPLRLEKLPPCSPELNPAERFFQELRKELANQIFETVEEIEAKLEEILQRYWKARVSGILCKLVQFRQVDSVLKQNGKLIHR